MSTGYLPEAIQGLCGSYGSSGVPRCQSPLLKDAQQHLREMKKCKQLSPVHNDKGLWVTGGRLASFNTLSGNPMDEAQAPLLTSHPYTRMLMI